MADLLLFPDVTPIARAYLLAGLAETEWSAVPVASRIPDPMPDWHIRVFALPGKANSLRTQWAQVITKVTGPAGADEQVSLLARVCAAVLIAAPDNEVALTPDGETAAWVSEPCELHGPFPITDPELPNRPTAQINITWTIQSQVEPTT